MKICDLCKNFDRPDVESMEILIRPIGTSDDPRAAYLSRQHELCKPCRRAITKAIEDTIASLRK